MSVELAQRAKEVIDSIYDGDYDNERINSGAYDILCELCDKATELERNDAAKDRQIAELKISYETLNSEKAKSDTSTVKTLLSNEEEIKRLTAELQRYRKLEDEGRILPDRFSIVKIASLNETVIFYPDGEKVSCQVESIGKISKEAAERAKSQGVD